MLSFPSLRRVLIAVGSLVTCSALAATSPQWVNLVGNASFEEARDATRPTVWRWSGGQSRARISIDRTVVRSGKQSIKLTNPSPKSPHVYGTLWQSCVVQSRRTYVLSCYVKGENTGRAWIGGGKRWEHRFPFPETAPEWTRVVGVFETGADETTFTVRILTEDVTDGIWIDDVMLEEGTQPGEFVFEEPLGPGVVMLDISHLGETENLLPNSSFEIVEKGRPRGWVFDRRNTDARMVVDESEPRSGKKSLLFTNGTKFGAHVYGILTLEGGVAVRPNTAYTISAFVLSDDPGRAWIGGGNGWHIRCPLRRTGYDGARVSKRFVTGPADTKIPIVIVTESPTAGFRIDDVKLEEGDYPTPYVLPGGPERAEIELAARLPPPVPTKHGLISPQWAPGRYPCHETAFVDRVLWLDGVLRLPKEAPGAAITLRVTDGDGKELCDHRRIVDLGAGASALTVGWDTADLRTPQATVAVTISDAAGAEITSAKLRLDVHTAAHVEDLLGQTQKSLAQLRERVATLAPRGQASRALATATVLEKSIEYARDDVNRGEIGRAYDAALTMNRMAMMRIAECDDVLAGKRLGWPDRRYRTSRIEIDGPSFVADTVLSTDKATTRGPVFFSGYGHFGAVRRDVEKFPRYGANMIQIEFGPRSVLVAENEVSEEAIDEFLSVCDRAAEAGVAVNLLLSPHYFPQWAKDKWPHLASFAGGFLTFDINAPEARDIVERSLRVVIPRIEDHPALHSLCLSNEPLSVDMSDSERGRRLWHDWLKTRYGTVAAMNNAWGADFADFADVPVQKEFTPDPVTYDFVCFNQEQFAAWHRWMADIIHEIAPDIPVHAKIMVGAHWGRHHHGIWSVSPELFGDLSQIHGNDCWKYLDRRDESSPDAWLCSWVAENMGYDFQRSMGDKPVFNSENHLIRDRDFDPVPPDFIYNVIWQGAMHGMSASTTWVWERSFDPGSGTAGSIMHRPDCTEAQNLACLDLNRLANRVTAFQQVAPRVVLLSSLASNVYDSDYPARLRDAYTAFNMSGVQVGFVTERQLARWVDGGPKPFPLRDAAILVLPAVSTASDTTMRGVARFADAGGQIVRIGECFVNDEHGQKRDAVPWAPGRAWEIDEAKALWPTCRALLREVGCAPSVDLQTADGAPVWGVELRTVEHNGRLLVNLANYLRIPQKKLRLVRNGKPVPGSDLITLSPVGPSFDLPPAMPMLIELAEGRHPHESTQHPFRLQDHRPANLHGTGIDQDSGRRALIGIVVDQEANDNVGVERCQRVVGHSLGDLGSEDDTETHGRVAEEGADVYAAGRRAERCEARIAPASVQAVSPVRRAGGVRGGGVGIWPGPVVTPLPDVPEHVLQTPWIGGSGPDGVCLFACVALAPCLDRQEFG